MNVLESDVENLLDQINENRRFYETILMKIETVEFKDVLVRLRMQKDLFIKEICRLFQIDSQEHFNDSSPARKGKYGDQLSEYNSSAKEVSYFDLTIRGEKDLLEFYENFLLDISHNEIANMILRNHINELVRDIQGLKNLQVSSVYVEAS